MNKIFCIGDIHGGYLALIQCLERSSFNYAEDTLICLGDVVDGWPDTPQCVEELLKVKYLIYINGNHDSWANEWLKAEYNYSKEPYIWTSQGGQATIDAYNKHTALIAKHKNFFDTAVPYHIDTKNRLYVHGGCGLSVSIEKQNPYDLTWDRQLFNESWRPGPDFEPYYEIYIGHTSTTSFSDIPIRHRNVWKLDQGGGYEGKLSIINVDTHEFWQSDKVSSLYPNHRGR